MSPAKPMRRALRDRLISCFVLAWLALFTYETTRAFFLCPLFGRELPKCKFLYPPAGWIMFYRVEEPEVRAEVFGRRSDRLEYIDPHRIFPVRWIGYDNIRRNVLTTVLYPYYAGAFLRYLHGRFPEYDGFLVTRVLQPSHRLRPGERSVRVVYGG